MIEKTFFNLNIIPILDIPLTPLLTADLHKIVLGLSAEDSVESQEQE